MEWLIVTVGISTIVGCSGYWAGYNDGKSGRWRHPSSGKGRIYRAGIAAQTTIGGWPGYHTHWTPLPPIPKEPESNAR